MNVQPHKAIVGANAFQHESGIHQDGMIKNKSTYEIMTPESVGLERDSNDAGIVLGKHSGRNAVATRLRALGYSDVADDTDRFLQVFERFKQVAEKKKGGLEDEDLEAIAGDEAYAANTHLWSLVSVQVTTGTGVTPTATVTMSGPDGVHRTVASTGTGPVDAVFRCIDDITAVNIQLSTYDLEAVTSGIDAMATTKVIVMPTPGTQLESTSLHASGSLSSKRFSGTGSDTDVVVSSARAYVNAVNKLINWNLRRTSASEQQADFAFPPRTNSSAPVVSPAVPAAAAA
mmetsp:Transcript_25592/g.32187  ORF Transcript_25592/g.32187 Transcript_25592/m.32187 type:complete len:288 (+) Transcript_25592:870-1733(+)